MSLLFSILSYNNNVFLEGGFQSEAWLLQELFPAQSLHRLQLFEKNVFNTLEWRKYFWLELNGTNSRNDSKSNSPGHDVSFWDLQTSSGFCQNCLAPEIWVTHTEQERWENSPLWRWCPADHLIKHAQLSLTNCGRLSDSHRSGQLLKNLCLLEFQMKENELCLIHWTDLRTWYSGFDQMTVYYFCMIFVSRPFLPLSILSSSVESGSGEEAPIFAESTKHWNRALLHWDHEWTWEWQVCLSSPHFPSWAHFLLFFFVCLCLYQPCALPTIVHFHSGLIYGLLSPVVFQGRR